MHGGVQVEVRTGGKHAGQGRLLDLAGELQLLVHAVLRLADVVLQGGDRGVDVVGQLGKLLIGPNVDDRVQVPGGDGLEPGVDLLQVAGDLLFQHLVDEDEQRRVDQHLHKRHQIQRHIAVQHRVVRGDAVDDLLGEAAGDEKGDDHAHQQPEAEVIADAAGLHVDGLPVPGQAAQDHEKRADQKPGAGIAAHPVQASGTAGAEDPVHHRQQHHGRDDGRQEMGADIEQWVHHIAQGGLRRLGADQPQSQPHRQAQGHGQEGVAHLVALFRLHGDIDAVFPPVELIDPANAQGGQQGVRQAAAQGAVLVQGVAAAAGALQQPLDVQLHPGVPDGVHPVQQQLLGAELQPQDIPPGQVGIGRKGPAGFSERASSGAVSVRIVFIASTCAS